MLLLFTCKWLKTDSPGAASHSKDQFHVFILRSALSFWWVIDDFCIWEPLQTDQTAVSTSSFQHLLFFSTSKKNQKKDIIVITRNSRSGSFSHIPTGTRLRQMKRAALAFSFWPFLLL